MYYYTGTEWMDLNHYNDWNYTPAGIFTKHASLDFCPYYIVKHNKQGIAVGGRGAIFLYCK